MTDNQGMERVSVPVFSWRERKRLAKRAGTASASLFYAKKQEKNGKEIEKELVVV